MKYYTFIFYCLFSHFVNGQTSCLPSTIPVEIFYPSTTNTGTVNVDINNIQYLCGPNTVLYDTSQSMCRQVYIDNFSTLYLKADCPATQSIWVKSNCILNIIDGPSVIFIHVEVGAIINQPAGPHSYSATIDTCSTIVYPNINCTTGLIEKVDEIKINIFPNPTNSILNVVDEKNQFNNATIEIKNQFGQMIYTAACSSQIDLSNLFSGMYFLIIRDNYNRKTIKFSKQ
jgi:hypothetical protein